MKLLVTLTTAIVLLALAPSAGASSWKLGQWDPGIHNAKNAVYYEWCHHHYSYCGAGQTAWRVSDCESGHSATAVNGEHKGTFQMGAHERRTFGDGPGYWRQAHAAHLYYLISGWSPWYSSESCWRE